MYSSALNKFIEPNFQTWNGVDLKMSIWETIFWSFVIILDGKAYHSVKKWEIHTRTEKYFVKSTL